MTSPPLKQSENPNYDALTRRSKWLMWRKLNMPTIALGILWVIHSLATTAYVPWQNRRQEKMLTANLAAIEATLRVEEGVSQLQYLAAPTVTADSKQAATVAQLDQQLASAISELRRHLQDHPSDTAVVNELESAVGALRSHMNSPASATVPAGDLELPRLVHQVVVQCNNLVRRHEQALLASVEQRSQTDVLVMAVRFLLLVLGLVVGVGLGMWMAQRFQRSISQISVSLRGADDASVADLGRIEVVPETGDGDLAALQLQVQHVVAKLRSVADELQQTRKDMVRAERLAAVGELAAGVAHEIRNPLTSVKLLVQRAAERKPVHSLNEEQLQVLLEEVSRIETTVQGLIDFARPSKPQRTLCDLNQLVHSALLLVEGRARQQQIDVAVDRCSQCRAEIDPGLVRQVVVNLLINAIDSMPQGGQLRISLGRDEELDRVSIAVEDSGAGIADDVLHRLFEPFVTTKARGCGLGLAISRALVEEHGGILSAANRPAGGAIFTVSLPRADELSSGSLDSDSALALSSNAG